MYVWNHEFYIEIPFSLIKQRLFDSYYQSWYSDINNSSRLKTYSLIKHEFIFENYLDYITNKRLRIALTRLRTSSHSLAIEEGRYNNTQIDNRLCKCQMIVIENEYHFMIVCPLYRDIRKKYLNPDYCSWPTLNKFENLMLSQSKNVQLNIAKYIHFAFIDDFVHASLVSMFL